MATKRLEQRPAKWGWSVRRLFRPHFAEAAVIALLALGARLLPGARTIDDAYITFRYARNILAGHGFVYNPGEHVLGTTTPLYTGLMALVGLFSGGENAPFPLLAMGVNALADAVTTVLLWKLGERLGSRRAGMGAALAWAILPFSVTFAIGGLETSLYILLLTGCVVAHVEKRPTLAAFTAALALLTRPDALLLVAPLAFDRALQILREREGKPRKVHWGELFAFALPTLGWVVFASLYFGNPLPHSLIAKSLAYRLSPTDAITRLLQHFATPFMGNLTFGAAAIATGLFLYPFLYLVGARRGLQNAPRLWPWVVYPWGYFAVFALVNPLIFRWYLAPPLPPYILFILLGADKIVGQGLGISKQVGSETNHGKRDSWRYGFACSLVVLLPFIFLLRGWTLHPDHGLPYPAPKMAWYRLELRYREAAELLQAEIQKSPVPRVLAAGDVGVLGYYTSARMLDTVGLNSLQAVRYYPIDERFYVIAYAVPPGLILEQRPDYVVLLEVYGREGLFKDPQVLSYYRLKWKIPTDIYGSDGLLIWERMDSKRP